MEKTLPDEFNQRLSLRGQPSVDVVIKVAPGTMEFVRLEKLKKLLLENPYRLGKMPDSFGLYKWDELMSMLEATHEELESALRVLSAVQINGYWRIVDARYMEGMLNTIILLSRMERWFLFSLDEDEVVESLADWGFPRAIAHLCLELYCSRTYGGGWEFDKRRACLHFALRILAAAANGKMKTESFMKEWARKFPGGMPMSLDMLEGEVLVENHGKQSWVRLPSDRFPGYFKNGPNGIGRIYTLTSVFQEVP